MCLIESCQTEGEFLPMLLPSSHFLLLKYNTFNSWEPHGERKKRVINVTYAVRLVLYLNWLLLGLLHSSPQNIFVIITIIFAHLNHTTVELRTWLKAHYVQSSSEKKKKNHNHWCHFHCSHRCYWSCLHPVFSFSFAAYLTIASPTSFTKQA